MGRLDPFQIVTAVNFGPPVETAVDHGFLIDGDNEGNYTLISNCENTPPSCIGTSTPFGVGYLNDFLITLSATLITCIQPVYQVTGRTGGASVILDIAGFYSALGWDCLSPDCSSCSYQIGDVAHFLTTQSVNNWTTGVTPPTNRIQVSIYTKAPLGFTTGERIDVTLPQAPKFAITSITERTPTTVWVATDADLQPDESWIRIEGSRYYDGDYKINDPAAGQFWIETTYLGVDETGTLQAKYDGPTSN